MAKNIFSLLFLLAHSVLIHAQKDIVTVGIQYKPIFSLDLLNTGAKSITANGVAFTVGLDRGFCAGIVVRRGITDTYSLESGINYVKRVYTLRMDDGNFSGTGAGGDRLMFQFTNGFTTNLSVGYTF